MENATNKHRAEQPSVAAMKSWRLAYDQAHAVDDAATAVALMICWDRAVDEIEAEGGDSNSDDVVAARAMTLFARG